jgi:hypothetical protein
MFYMRRGDGRRRRSIRSNSQKEIGGRFFAPPRAREVPIDHTGWRPIDQ